MAVTSREQFLTLLERTGLLTIEQLDAAQEATAGIDNPKTLARQLIADKVLTRWQAAQILAGGSKLNLGKYRLLDQLGSSPTGKVYLAENRQLDRKVAIKAINRRKVGDSDQLKRFQEEARTVAMLDHRNIVHAYDVDREGNLDMIVMEHVDGSDLKQMVAKHDRLPIWRAANYIFQAAQGLAHAHERGVTHGDLKPSNMLVDSHGVLKIVDIGVARFSQANGDDAAGRTAIGFLSPEQVRGVRGDEPASDLFSLGCSFYFLLIGRPPFAESNDLKVLLKQQAEGPTPIERIREEVPAELIAVCDKLMASDPKKRYGSASEVADELKEWLDANPPQLESESSESTAEFAIEAEPPRWSASGSHKSLSSSGSHKKPKPARSGVHTPESKLDEEFVESGKSRNKLLAVGGVVVVLIAVAAFLMTRSDSDPDPDDDETAENTDDDTDSDNEPEKDGATQPEGGDDEKDGGKDGGKPAEPVDKSWKPADNEVVWVDDDTPRGSIAKGSENFASWQWVEGEGHQVHSGKVAVLRKSAEFSQHLFEGARKPLVIEKDDKLFAYVWLDPQDTPEMVMLQWNDGTWAHGAYWGADKSTFGKPGTAARHSMGGLPAAGEWVRLEVKADNVGLAPGAKINGMAFNQFGGTAYWDTAGVRHFKPGDESVEPEKPKPDPGDVVEPEKPKPPPKPVPPKLRPKGEPELKKDPTMVLAQSHPVEVVTATADKGVQLVKQPDGSLRAEGPNPAGVTYQVVVKTSLPQVTGLKLECLRDEPLPAKGPGRRKDGAFIVTQLKAFVSDSPDFKNQKPLALNDVAASFETTGWVAKSVIDGKPQTGWSTAGQPGKDQSLVATFKNPVNDDGGKDAWLKLVIRQGPNDSASLGCFRVRLLTGREVSQEFATLPKFPVPPNPLAALPERVALPELGKGAAEAGATDPMEIGAMKLASGVDIDARLLGADNALAGRGTFSIENVGADANPAWQVKFGEDETVATVSVKDDKLWFQWTDAAVASKSAEHLGNCILELTTDNNEHRIALRQPIEVDAIALFPAGGKMGASFRMKAPPKADQIRWEVVDLKKSLPESSVKPEGPYALKQGAQIGIGTLGDETIFLQLTPSSKSIHVSPYFRIMDGQKPQRLTPVIVKRMAASLTSRIARAQRMKAQLESIKNANLKKQYKPQLDQVNKELPEIQRAATRLAAVEKQAKDLSGASPLRFRIFYQIDEDTRVELVEASGGAAEQ